MSSVDQEGVLELLILKVRLKGVRMRVRKESPAASNQGLVVRGYL